jgi:hypothetical protein
MTPFRRSMALWPCTTFDKALQLVAKDGPGSTLVKRDLADAFHHIPVSPQDWWLLSFRRQAT